MHPKNMIAILSGGEMKAAIYFPNRRFLHSARTRNGMQMVRQPIPPAQPRRCISQVPRYLGRANGPGNIDNLIIRQGH